MLQFTSLAAAAFKQLATLQQVLDGILLMSEHYSSRGVAAHEQLYPCQRVLCPMQQMHLLAHAVWMHCYNRI